MVAHAQYSVTVTHSHSLTTHSSSLSYSTRNFFASSSGKTIFADFLSQFEACRDYNGWSIKETAFQLFLCCDGDALSSLTRESMSPKVSLYADMVEVLEREFGPRECKSSYILELNQVKQGLRKVLVNLVIESRD